MESSDAVQHLHIRTVAWRMTTGTAAYPAAVYLDMNSRCDDGMYCVMRRTLIFRRRCFIFMDCHHGAIAKEVLFIIIIEKKKSKSPFDTLNTSY